MVKLSAEHKQMINGGAIPAAGIALLHGIIHITWAALDAFNVISDILPKKPMPVKSVPQNWSFDNNLINSKITIFS